MILYDPALDIRFRDYGIMIPIPPNRGKRAIQFVHKKYYPGTRGHTFPYPGPVFTAADAVKYLNLSPGNPGLSREDLERVHSKGYIAALYNSPVNGETGLSFLERALLESFELIDERGRPNRYRPKRARKSLGDLFSAVLAQAGGTCLACRLALAEGAGFCYYLGGGQHHARYDAGAGFCLINDVAAAAVKTVSDPAFRPQKPPRLVWIVDLDAHKGDGTAELIRFARERGELADPAAEVNLHLPCVLTMSMHMAKGWPLDAETLARATPGRAPLLPSDVDAGIEKGEEGAYIKRLEAGIRELERLAAKLPGKRGAPDLILVVDGADPYEHDGLPSSALLGLTLDQCLQRDLFVYRYALDRGIPSAWIAAGGYGRRAWEPPAYFLRSLR